MAASTSESCENRAVAEFSGSMPFTTSIMPSSAGLRQRGEVARLAQHRFFHQRIAGANRHAVPARNAARLADRRAAIPQHARMLVLPVGWSASRSPARSGRPPRSARTECTDPDRSDRRDSTRSTSYGLGRNGISWCSTCQQLRGVVHRAVAVVVVADRAIEQVVAEDAVERLALRLLRPRRLGRHLHAVRSRRRAGPHQLAVHLHHAGVAGLDRSQSAGDNRPAPGGAAATRDGWPPPAIPRPPLERWRHRA